MSSASEKYIDDFHKTYVDILDSGLFYDSEDEVWPIEPITTSEILDDDDTLAKTPALRQEIQDELEHDREWVARKDVDNLFR